MAQAAGRCNRAGGLADENGRPVPGRLILFRSPKGPPPGLRLGADTTTVLLNETGGLDLFDPMTYEAYFRRYFADVDADARQVMPARQARDFPKVEEQFGMIDEDGQVSVVVPFGDAAERIESYRAAPGRQTLRALQPFLVGIPARDAGFLNPLLEEIHDHVRWLKPGPQYDPRFGLVVDQVVPLDPRNLVSD